ncbi:hydrogenase nickel incorporation protein HypB [Desulfoprunum benzoelyticum]|jgi:hydrogenase nickel incorporation protein HypB|uniref:Hydrogenase nickel incorporation protein HypB n=1 Tax=Desulfoprunum benzoelyticum TaxID=1506996 RepID=A0A840V2Z7_9BACT|nr:hydrogenase nickel incorporation protein HypB [Desulfoprunum benzoelyticum]MBB5348109.1 hydrogenase nickel incorporation protein HypB [Desulfoprunum benzoelyticum]MBM9530280.1 hydrogenase nickel incorporation protein HypB [Desulfoprunum benzoelyticum]
MCDSCGCPSAGNLSSSHSHDGEGVVHTHGTAPGRTVDVHASLFAANDALARINRDHFDDAGAVVLNLISSPGSGKTTLLEHTIDALKGEISIGVIEGDIETERDADRIRAKGVPAVQLTTGGACHLDAAMIHRGFHLLQKEQGGDRIDLLFIENVGNLVCPATFDLGEHERVVLVSVPEGPDKPAKYPKAFTSSNTFLITKTDLLPYFDFPVAEATREALQLNPQLQVIDLCATKGGEGFDTWLGYLRNLVSQMKAGTR